MNHRIIELDGRFVLLDRIDDWDEEKPHRVWLCHWHDDINRFDEHHTCNSVREAQAFIATFDEAAVRAFLERADEAFELRLIRVEAG